jgi:uncharacterized protein YyaL (SSP411 family)
MPESKANRLIDEQSPYLLQHAHNPVDWYPWGEEAFEKAREEDKPIFLSIGYSTCHWCHVMEHESFEDPETAKILKEHFVSIKVDREERPDIDRIYMSFVQASTGQGGWPMSVWLTPELKPFVGGTYFPPRDAHGRPGFQSVLLNIAEAWKSERDKILQHGTQVVESLSAATGSGGALAEISPDCLEQASAYFTRTFDAEEGGFGSAPKFPRPVIFEYLFHRAASRAGVKGTENPPSSRPDGEKPDEREKEMALHTLRRMAEGGMHDHLGGGFHRYSVDRAWHVPHFEKMLYDQAQLARAYLIAYQMTGEAHFADVARGIFRYVERDMRSPDGGFYSAEDADSYPEEGAARKLEGAFYVWEWNELHDLLSPAEFKLVIKAYNLEPNGNVSPASDPHGELTGKNVLTRRKSALEPGEWEVLAEANEKMFAARENRIRPHLDDKVITAWNGMMVSALTYGYQVLGDESYLTMAREAVKFIHRELADLQSGKLERSFRKSSSGIHAFAEDYAQWIEALIDLYEASGEIEHLKNALIFQEAMDQKFWDESGGYFSGQAGNDVLIRIKDDNDGAEPSANSVAALNLARLADMLQRKDLLDRSEKTLKAFSSIIDRFPAALPLMLNAVAWHRQKPRQVVLAGDRPHELRSALFRHYHPAQVILYADGKEGQQWLSEQGLPMKEFVALGGKAAAYLCQDFSCQLPVTDPKALLK